MLLSFIIFIFAFGIYEVVSEDRPVSTWENRSLAQKPELTFSNVVNGEFMSAYETYITDQFPIRDGWLKAHVLIEKYTNQTFINDFHITDDNFVIKEGLNYQATDNMNVSIKQMNALGETAKNAGSELYYFFLPARVITLAEMYPDFINAGYTEFSKDYVFDGITNENVQKFDLSEQWIKNYSINERKELFYQTDHHWNEKGSLKGYEFIRNTLAEKSNNVQVEPFKAEDYTTACSDQLTFLGSYNLQLYKAVTGHHDVPCNNISTVYDYDHDFTIQVGNKESGTVVKASSIYGSKMKDTAGDINYAQVFMQDMAEITVTNNVKVQAGEESKALIIKDSFANAINLLVAENFAQTSILDIRHFNSKTIEQYIKDNNFDAIIILYNGETIFSSMYNFDGTAS